MGRPVLMPDVNISHLFRDGVDAVLLRTGNAEEIASKCIDLFSDPQQAGMIGRAGRLLAEKYFDVRSQACRLAARGRSTFSELRWYPPMEAAEGSLSWVFRAKQPESFRTGP